MYSDPKITPFLYKFHFIRGKYEHRNEIEESSSEQEIGLKMGKSMGKYSGRILLKECGLEDMFKEILTQSPCPLRDDVIDRFLRGVDNPVIRDGLNKAIRDYRRIENRGMRSCLLKKIMNYSIKKWIICYLISMY